MKKTLTIKHTRSALLVALIGLFLLAGQYGALIHSVDHPFHAPNQSCQTFTDLEHAGNGMVSCDFHLASEHFTLPRPPVFIALSPATRPSVYSPRAPPVTS